MENCPCGSSKLYDGCCGMFIAHLKTAPTPETLMRSRYTAYTQANIAYIVETMKELASDGFNALEAEKWAKQVTWLGLEVRQAEERDDLGWVEFIARYSHENQQHVIHELSRFRRENGRWFYVDGEMIVEDLLP